jgi:uncharacterized protein (DUF1697 family)
MRQVALLRGINLGAKRRVPMADLRERLGGAGYGDVQTYLQSGNIVLDSKLKPAKLAGALGAELAEWYGFEVPVVVRTEKELAAIVAADPLEEAAEDPKRYVVVFLDRKPAAAAVSKVAETAVDGERLVHRNREIFVHYTAGQARSKLSLALTDAKLGVLATARNWTTVTTLTEMAAG